MEKLNVGLNTMVQNTIYALPASRCTVFTDAATPTIQTSTTDVFTANTVVTLTAGVAEVGGAFMRVTSAGPISVMIKKF